MVRWLGIVILILGLGQMACAQVFWLENFTGVTNGATTDGGATAWTTTQPSSGTFAKTTVLGQDVFLIDNTTTEGVWRSSVINIAAQGEVAVEVTLGANFSSSSDYVRAFYILDGGLEIQFGEVTGTPALTTSTAASTIVVGTTVQIVIRGKDNTPGTTASIPNATGFDDVTLTKISLLYSRASGNWDDTNTWSAIGYSGASCGCVPDDNSRVIIGNNRTVSLEVAGFVSGIDVQNTGKLQWSANSLAMTMRHGGVINVETGGVMTNNSQTGSSIIFNSYAYTATVDGALTIGTLTFNTGATFVVGGAGVLTAATVTAGMGTSRFITNNITGPGASFTVTGNINFPSSSSANAVLNNNGTMSAAQILFSDQNVNITNTGTLTLSGNVACSTSSNDNNKITNAAGATFSFAGIAVNNSNLIILNSGTINQSGNFVSLDNGSSYKNLATGTWNWTLTPNSSFDTDILTALDLSAAGNTFNYNGGGNQSIAAIAYSNLSLSVSGTKTRSAAGTLVVGGNLLIQNAAVLDISTPALSDLSVAGNWTVLNTASFTEGLRTVTFNGTGMQTISNAAGETFYNLTLNTTASTDRVTMANAINVTNVLTLTRGGLKINGNALAITNVLPGAISSTANGFIISEATGTPYSRVNWSMRTTVNTFTIPFADATGTAIPFTFNKTSAGTESGTGIISVATYHTAADNTPYPAGITDVNRNGSDNSANVADRFWIIVPSSYITVPNATVTFSVTPAEATGITANTLRAQHWASPWEQPIAGQTNPTAATQARVAIPGTALSSIWTLSGNNSPLPIQLISFTAEVVNDAVVTRWKTAQEIHNDYFTVQKSIDGEKYLEVGMVNGQGDSFTEHAYTLSDPSPFSGTSYYRLRQTDFDGHYTYSDPVKIAYEVTDLLTLNVYPNPSIGVKVDITMTGLKDASNVPVAIYSLLGIKVYEVILPASAGAISSTLEFGNQLPSGIYVVRAGVSGQFATRLVVE